MKRNLLRSLLLVAVLSVAGCASAQKPVRVLFVGNSYTYYNNLPQIVETLFEQAGGGEMETGMLVGAGQTLSDVAGPRLPELLTMMLGGRWDYVVLQEQSTLGGGFRAGRPVIGSPDAFHRAVRALDREIRKAGGQTALLVTWANERAPEQQAEITRAYLAIASEIGAPVARAGDAWADVRNAYPAIRLHREDGSHPSENGSYLTACTLLETLFEVDLEGSPTTMTVTDLLSSGRRGRQVISIDEETAGILREVAARQRESRE